LAGLLACVSISCMYHSKITARAWIASHLIALMALIGTSLPLAADDSDQPAKKPEPPAVDLWKAAIAGDNVAVRQHIAAGTDLNAKDRSLGSTPLHVASFFAHPETVKLLLENGAEVNARNNRGETPLDPASAKWGPVRESAYKAAAEALQIKLDLKRIEEDRPKIVTLLREAGGKKSADLTPEPPKNIFEAAIRGDTESMGKFLEAGADINGKELSGGATPLLLAALFGQTEATAWLIDRKAKLSATSKRGSSALHLAAFFAHPDTVQLLLEKGVPTDTKNLKGETALDSVSAEWSPELAGEYKVLSLALQVDLDLAKVKAERPKVAEILLKAGEK
jgi:hypothetical protein